MSFDHASHNGRILAHVQQTQSADNSAAAYDVRIEEADLPPDALYWRAIGIHHLTPTENRSNHHTYVECLDEQGHRVRQPNLRIGWTWTGRSEDEDAPPVRLDKPDNEPAGNVPIQSGVQMAVWIQGDGLPSDRVVNLHTHHADEPTATGELWNTIGHHSFYVVFQRTRAAGTHVEQPDQTPTLQIGQIPNCFTNQQLINAFFFAAKALNISGDDLMGKAGLDVHHLAADAATRQSPYTGPEVHRLPNLAADEYATIVPHLVRELQKTARWRGMVDAQAGLNLREQANQNSRVLRSLPHQTALDVLDDGQTWLFVAVDSETAGFVHGNFVARALPQHDFFMADEQLRMAPLAPPTQIQTDAGADPGAQILASIWNRYGGLLEQVAQRLAIDPAAAVAVLSAESGGAAFSQDGRMPIRFENHLFYREWGQRHQERFFQHFDFNRETNESWLGHKWRASPRDPFQSIHRGQALEWQVFHFAVALDDTAAKRSISMGAPQILGSNHERIGYGTVQEMFDAFATDERNQILGLFDFIRSDAGMVRALQQRNYRTFAQKYNGPGQAERYAQLIADSVQAFENLTTLSFGMANGGAPRGERVGPIAFLPMPQPPDALTTIEHPAPDAQAGEQTTAGHLDPEVHDAWVAYVQQGLENNNLLFNRILRAFIVPYYITVAMYVLLFAVGIGLFVLAALLATQEGARIFGLIFAGLSVATFIGYFLSRPLRSLEENLQFITWLGVTYNTYWTRLLYMQNSETVHADLKDANAHAVQDILNMLDKGQTMSGQRPGSKLTPSTPEQGATNEPLG